MSSRNQRRRPGEKRRKGTIVTIVLAIAAVVLLIAAVRTFTASPLLKSGNSFGNGRSSSIWAEASTAGDPHAEEENDQKTDSSSGGIRNLVGNTASDPGKPDQSDSSAASVGQNEQTAAAEKREGSDRSSSATDSRTDRIEQTIAAMPLEEKVDQLFVVTPDQLTDTDGTVICGTVFQNAIVSHPVGGFIFFENNLESPEQTRQLLSGIRGVYQDNGFPAPLLSVDEEGGTVTRIAKNSAFGVTNVGNMKDIGASGDISRADYAGDTIGTYLSDLGFNTDFAPVADVLTNPGNTVVAKRSFGSDPDLVTNMVQTECTALLRHGICPVLKHFPGHGATEADTHDGYAYTDKTLDELMQAELLPFEHADAYAPMIMAAHISVPNVIGDGMPSSLSHMMITDILRERLGYQGVIITDALNMGAIANDYSSSEASVKAIQAGCDMLLMPMSFSKARQGILSAVTDGRLSEERIDESLRRILSLKQQ